LLENCGEKKAAFFFLKIFSLFSKKSLHFLLPASIITLAALV
jgi:hypothetical protein